MGKKSRQTVGRNKRAKLNSKTTITTTTTVDNSRISSLPDCLLVSILNLLPTKTVVSTSVLSTRWKHLYTQLTHISFTCPRDWECHVYRSKFLLLFDDFLTGIRNTLDHLTSPKIYKFELIMEIPRHTVDWHTPFYNLLVGTWIRLVCSRHPEDFSVMITPCDYYLPALKIPADCIFQCDSIVSLNLGEYFTYEKTEIVNLPNLRKLKMVIPDEEWFVDDEFFTRFCKCVPLLEELFLKIEYQIEARALKIICPMLRRLELGVNSFSKTVDFDIDAPKLETLSILSLHTGFRFVNHDCRLDGVDLDVRQSLWADATIYFLGYISEAFKELSSVRFLQLNGYILDHINSLDKKGLLIFHNVTELRVKYDGFSKLSTLFGFLKMCPNLVVLVLSIVDQGYCERNGIWEEPEFEHACLLAKVRVLELELNDFRVMNYYMNFIEYALRSGSSLEKLLFSVSPGFTGYYLEDEAKEYEVRDKLFSYPRDSSCCEIKFTGKYVTAASIK